MKLHKLASAALACIVGATLLASCGSPASSAPAGSSTAPPSASAAPGGSTAPSGDVTEVTFWTLNTKQGAVDPLVEEFNANQDKVKVVVSYYDTDGIKDACKVAASSNSLPSMWFNWGGSLGGFYTNNGLTYNLNDYASANNWDNKFIESVLNLCTFDGQLAGYPAAYNVVAMYYRADIFEENDLAVPTTFEEFEALCAALKAKGITPISTGGLNGWHTMRIVELFIEYYAGAELHDAMNTFDESYDNEAVVKALTKYQEFCDKGYFPAGFTTADPNDTQLALYSGQAAMDIQGQWYDGMIVSEGQDINNFKTFALPTVGSNRMSAFAEMIQLNANLSEAELDACIQWLDYYNEPENAKKYPDYFNWPQPIVGAEMPEGQLNVPEMIETSNANGTFTITDQAFPTEVADALFNVQDGIANGQITPEDGAAAIQAAIEAYTAGS